MQDWVRQSDSQALVQGAQRGNLQASELLVNRFQGELLRAAFLLTDDRVATVQLAEQTFDQTFQELRRFDPDQEFRPWLYQHLARAFMDDLPSDGSRYLSPDSLLSDPEPSHFNVDNERTRLRTTLLLLDKTTRSSLVLHDFSGLDIDQIATALDRKPVEVERWLVEGRQRVTSAIELPEGQSLSIALNDGAIDAPRYDLWSLLEEPVAEAMEREQTRSRALALGAVGVVVMFLLGALAVLVFGALRSDGEDGEPNVATLPTLTPEVETSPTAPIQPTAVLYPPYIPAGEVSDSLIYRLPPDQDRQTEPIYAIYDPSEGELAELAAGELVGISPDGSQLFFLTETVLNGEAKSTLVALASPSNEVLWQFEIPGFQHDLANNSSFDITIGKNRVYLATRNPSNSVFASPPFQIKILDREGGFEVHSWLITVDPSVGNRKVDAHLFLPPDETQLQVVIKPEQLSQIALHQYSLPSPDAIATSSADISPAFSFNKARLTPDGRGLYQPPASGPQEQAVVRFLTFDILSDSALELPFEPVEAGRERAFILESTVSHDGRWLYVASPYDQQIAIVDLERRTLDRLIPLDMGTVTPTSIDQLGLPAHYQFYGENTIQIAPDGERIYLVGTAHTGEGVAATSIWVIDTSTWSVVDQWLTDSPAPIRSIYLTADGGLLYIATTPVGVQPEQVQAIDTATGEFANLADIQLPAGTSLEIPADIYRASYGKSPSVAGVVPIDNRIFTSLPIPEITVEPPITSPEEPVNIQVRFLNPADRQLITETTPGIRFDPATTITGILSRSSRQQVLVFGQDGYGAYSTRTILPGRGSWDLVVAVAGTDAPAWTIQLPEAVRNLDPFIGNDGRDYVIEIEMSPAQPTAGGFAEITVRFINAATGKPLPLDADLEGGMPNLISIAVSTDALAGPPATLFRSGHDSYSGFITFWESGIYQPVVSFRAPDGQLHSTTAGSVTIP